MKRRMNLWARLAFVTTFSIFGEANGQFSADYQTNTISGVVSNWTGSYVVGPNFVFDALLVQNGGELYSNMGNIGSTAGANNNTAIVSGNGSIWNINSFPIIGAAFLHVGFSGSANSLVISNGGVVSDDNAIVGRFSSASNNSVWVSDSGSTWNTGGNLLVGSDGTGNKMTVTNGGVVVDGSGVIGSGTNGNANSVWVTGCGSVWSNRYTLIVGNAGASNCLVVSDCGAVFAGHVIVARFSQGQGTLTIDGGTLAADTLILTNTTGHLFLNTGTLTARATFMTNGQEFVVGDGVSAANFHLLGGTHSFNDGLRVRNASFLTGCGTINGTVVVDAGGTVLADCSPLVFTGSVTNNGTMRAINGSAFEAYGDVVNNGVIDIITGTTNFHGSFINNGTILTSNDVRIVEISKSGDDMIVKCQSYTGHDFQLQVRDLMTAGSWSDIPPLQSGDGTVLTFTDAGGATNLPTRFYRVRCSP